MLFLIYPTQLFEKFPAATPPHTSEIILIEDPVYFTRFKFHKLKLAYHRATMRNYFDYLRKKQQIPVRYVGFDAAEQFYMTLDSNILIYDPVDHILDAKLRAAARDRGLKITVMDTPAFLETREQLQQYQNERGDANYAHDSSFYRWQRRRLNVLMRGDKPVGEWTYDAENRGKFPSDIVEPIKMRVQRSPYIDEAIQYVNKHFPGNYGSTEHFIYPIDHAGAKRHFRRFLRSALANFGQYQDSSAPNIAFGYHSVISCMLNNGLLTPRYVLDETLKHARSAGGGQRSVGSGQRSAGENNQNIGGVPMNSLEGFIRQIIGWRSYCRLIYEYEGERMRKMNYWRHSGKLAESWWNGDTGLKPLDDIIARVTKYAYAHHIERLMYVGAVMLMCQIHPDEVFKWFISHCSIDAYDWVMVPNIYGMSQYSDGGIMMTRPYFSSSNYIRKMSTWPAGPWTDIWDALYYNFIDKHATKLSRIYSTASGVAHWQKKSAKYKRDAKRRARKFIRANTTLLSQNTIS